MSEKPFQKFDEVEISEDEIESLRSGIKPPDSNIDMSKESDALRVSFVEEIELEMSPEVKKLQELKNKLEEEDSANSFIEEL